MGKLIPKYARVPLLICAAAQFLAYYLPRALPRLPYAVDMATGLDGTIPLVPAWIAVYVAAYLYWVVGYVTIARVSPGVCARFCRADWMVKAVAFLFFFLLPTRLSRAGVEGGGAFCWLLRAVYAADPPDNLFPSMHCAVSWLVTRQLGVFGPRVRIAAFGFASLVCLSTLFTKQHLIADVIGGILLAEGAIFVSRKWVRV